MSSVKITKATFTRSGSTINGLVTVEAAYNEAETRLDVGFVPTVILTPSYESTKLIVVGYGGSFMGVGEPAYLVGFRNEVTLAMGVVRPSGERVVTLSFTVALSSLFQNGYESLFPADAGGLDWRVELRPEISLSTGVATDQKLVTAAPPAASSALQFDGVNNFIEVDSALPITTQVTVEMWARGEPRAAHLFYITDAGRSARLLSAHTPWADGNVYFDGGNDAGGGYDRLVKGLSPLDDKSTWVHWAFVRDSAAGRMSVYRNGALWLEQATGMTRPMTGATRLVIGAQGAGDCRFCGAIAEVRVWNVARSADQIKADMSHRTPTGLGLIAAYSLSQASASVPDWSGNGRDATLRGSAVTVPGPTGLV